MSDSNNESKQTQNDPVAENETIHDEEGSSDQQSELIPLEDGDDGAYDIPISKPIVKKCD
jgi:hypothetical protein